MQNITAEYAALTTVYASFSDPNHIWPIFAEELRSRLPLPRILPPASMSATSSASPNLGIPAGLSSRFTRPLSNVNIEFRPMGVFQNASTSSAWPHFHLLLIACEDFDTYKATVRKIISDWLEGLHAFSKQHSTITQQAIIIYVTNSIGVPTAGGQRSAAASTSSIFSIKTNVFDRIKSDFGSAGANNAASRHLRFVLLRLGSNASAAVGDEPGPLGWSDCLEGLGEALYAGFINRAILLEDEIRRLDAQRQLPGWNYLHFFLTKESLAFAYESVGLYEDSLIQYDELEAVFMEVFEKCTSKPLNNSTSNMELLPSWMPSIGGQQPGDETGNILDFTRKPYRQLATANQLSLFDLNIYLFARQAHLLLRLDRLTDLLQRARQAINKFAMIPWDYERDHLPALFRTRWSFCACLAVLSLCERVSSNVNDSSSIDRVVVQSTAASSASSATEKALALAKAGLALLARQQLDKIGPNYFPTYARRNSLALIPQQPADIAINAIMNLDNSKKRDAKSAGVSEDFSEILADPRKFDHAYQKLTRFAMDGFSLWNRQRTVNFLTDELASLHLFFGRYEEALGLLEALAREHNQLGQWSTICHSVLRKVAKCYKGLEDYPRYIIVCFDILRLGLQSRSAVDAEPVLKEISSAASDHAGKLDMDVAASPFVETKDLLVFDAASGVLELEFVWKLSASLTVEFIEVVAVLALNSEEISIPFTSSVRPVTIKPGQNKFRLKCERRIVGHISPQSLLFSLGNRHIRLNLNVSNLPESLSFHQRDHDLFFFSQPSRFINLCGKATVDIVIGSRKEDIVSPHLVFDDLWDLDGLAFAVTVVPEGQSYDVNQIPPQMIQMQRGRPTGKCFISIPNISAGKQAIIQVPRLQDNLKLNLWLTYKSKDHQSGVLIDRRIEESVKLADSIYSWTCVSTDSEKRLIWKENERIFIIGLSIFSSKVDESDFYWIIEWDRVRSSSKDSKDIKKSWNNAAWQLGSKLSLFASVPLPDILKEETVWDGFAEFLLKIRHSSKDDLEFLLYFRNDFGPHIPTILDASIQLPDGKLTVGICISATLTWTLTAPMNFVEKGNRHVLLSLSDTIDSGWLISGKTQFRIDINETKTAALPINLTACRSGRLTIPRIAVVEGSDLILTNFPSNGKFVEVNKDFERCSGDKSFQYRIEDLDKVFEQISFLSQIQI